MQKQTAKQIFDLLTKRKIVGSKGMITFNLSKVSMTIKSKDVVGNIIQDWVGEWMKSESILFSEPDNSQEFPDYFLDSDDKKDNLLEIKTFDDDAGANFDIANFQAYCRSLKTNAYRLDADYLIFSYDMDSTGNIIIKDIWLKKIWEISGPSEAYPIRIQQKQSVIYNIRPIGWYGSGSPKYKPFETKQDFVIALHKTLLKYPKTQSESKNWLNEVNKNYKEHTGLNLFK